jgi:hypothetical protein
MAQRVFFLNKLREGVKPEAYEKWVREVDYPLARSLPAIDSYVVTRLDGLVMEEGGAPYDYLEVVEITSLEEYRAALSGGPEVEEFFEEWSSYVAESVAAYGEVIE